MCKINLDSHDTLAKLSLIKNYLSLEMEKSASDNLKKAYKTVFRTGLTLNEAIEKAKSGSSFPEVVNFLSFIETSGRGITR